MKWVNRNHDICHIFYTSISCQLKKSMKMTLVEEPRPKSVLLPLLIVWLLKHSQYINTWLFCWWLIYWLLAHLLEESQRGAKINLDQNLRKGSYVTASAPSCFLRMNCLKCHSRFGIYLTDLKRRLSCCCENISPIVFSQKLSLEQVNGKYLNCITCTRPTICLNHYCLN